MMRVRQSFCALARDARHGTLIPDAEKKFTWALNE